MYSITRYGKPLDNNLYTIDESNKTFSSKENNIVLDFSNESNWDFKTGSYCTFRTGSNCTFNTGFDCTFKTGSDCTFYTGSHCTFKTRHICTFKTGSYCTFDTTFNCTFNTGYSSTFKTGSICTFIICYKGFIKCEDESPITILLNNNKKINTFTIPNQIMYINEDKITTWSNKDLILNCKNLKFKDACNFFMEKD